MYLNPVVTPSQCVQRWKQWLSNSPMVMLACGGCCEGTRGEHGGSAAGDDIFSNGFPSCDAVSSCEGSGSEYVLSTLIECIPRLRTSPTPKAVVPVVDDGGGMTRAVRRKEMERGSPPSPLERKQWVRVFVLLKSKEVAVCAPDISLLLQCLPKGIQTGLRRSAFDDVGVTEALVGPLALLDPLYNELRATLQMIASCDLRQGCIQHWVLDGLPRCIRQLLFCNSPQAQLSVRDASTRTPSDRPEVSHVHPTLWNCLRRHQREGVIRALELKGRILFGDDMGVGKTLQTIATMQALRAFPCLVVCPAGLRHLWIDAIETWWPDLALEDLHVIHGSNDMLPQGAHLEASHDGMKPANRDQHNIVKPMKKTGKKVVICSYHMLAALREDMLARSWTCVVVDESHMLRPSLEGPCGDAQYSQVICSLGRRAEYCLMLSGTPSLTAPFGLYLQADTIRPGILGPTRFDFAIDYCNIAMDPFLSIGTCDRVEELRQLLMEYVMIRRTKAEVLDDLPPKVRVVVHVTPVAVSREHASRGVDESDVEGFESPGADGTLARDGSTGTPHGFPSQYAAGWKHHRKELMAFVTALCKQHAAANEKLVIFAHHIELLNALTDTVSRVLKAGPATTSVQAGEPSVTTHTSIFIDGSVSPAVRPALIDRFHTNPNCLVAIVGVTAAAVGISLSSASKCLFAELPPDASWLQQAEDRLHRPNQKSTVTSLIVVDPTSQFDTKMLAAIHESYVATKDVLDGRRNNNATTASTTVSGEADDCAGDNTALERHVFVNDYLTSAAACDSFSFAPQPLRLGEPSLVCGNSASSLRLQLESSRARQWNPRKDVFFQISPETCRLHIAVDTLGPTSNMHDPPQFTHLGSVPLEEARCMLLVSSPPNAASTAGPGDVITASIRAFLEVWDSLSWFARHRWSRGKHHASSWCNVDEMHSVAHAGTEARKRCRAADSRSNAEVTPIAAQNPLERGTASRGTKLRFEQKWPDHRLLHPYAPCSPPRPFVVWRVQYQAGVPPVEFPGPAVWVKHTRHCGAAADNGCIHGSEGHFACGCLGCSAVLEPAAMVATGQLLTIGVGGSDTQMFCSGACRLQYFFTKSNSAIRHVVHSFDGGRCNGCGVDCDALWRSLLRLHSIEERRRFLHEAHPAFLVEAPKHAARLLRNPSAGHCWHADHIVPVSQGGGCAALNNIQTLCVSCHVVKSRFEASQTGTTFAVDGGPASPTPQGEPASSSLSFDRPLQLGGSRSRAFGRHV